MNEFVHLIPAFIAGSLTGTIFFGGLWWTVNKGMTSPYAALWFIGSLVVRFSITLAGFYWVGRDDWQRLLACLVGFIVSRIVVTRWAASQLPQHTTTSHNATSSHLKTSTEIHNAS